MTDTDENLLTLAKLGEVARGDLDGDVLDHAGLVDGDDLASLSFVENTLRNQGDSFRATDLGAEVLTKFQTDAAQRAVEDGDASLAASIVGVTEQELDASRLTVTARLLERIDADGTLTTVLAAGRPNTGKSNTMFLLADLAREKWPDLLVVSNSPTWSGDDVTVSSMTELLAVLVENRDRPKAVFFDEASRYMDARTYSHEVSSQYTPFLKAGSKLGVQVAGHIGHTGKDVVPAVKRLTNLAFWKMAPTEVRFFNRWEGDDDRPSDPLFDADLVDLEPTLTDYDPDDVASWDWDLDPSIYANFDSWDDFANRL